MNFLIIGGGLMGLQITMQASLTGNPVSILLHAGNENENENMISSARVSLERLRKRFIRSKQQSSVIDQFADITFLTHLDSLGFHPEVVIEAVTEDKAIKQALFQKLDSQLRPGTFVFSNTSSLSISSLLPANARCKYGFMHFFNPLDMIPYVEVGSSAQSIAESEIICIAKEAASSLMITAIEAKDSAGYIGNRLLFALLKEACYLECNNIASIEDIDLVVTKVLGLPASVSKIRKIVGHDLCESIISNIFSSSND